MKKLILAALVIVCAVSPAMAEDFTKADIEKIIGEYIAANGGKIADSVEAYMARKQTEEAWKSVSEHSPKMGAKNGQIVFIEYGDFRCGYCRRVQETVSELMKRYNSRVTFAFKHFPILSEVSMEAAKAAQAAHLQGKFQEYSVKLWENQANLGEKLFTEIAQDLKLDMKKFDADRKSAEVEADIMVDFQDARALGAQGTPFFNINGATLSGAQALEDFIAVIEDQLAKAEKSKK